MKILRLLSLIVFRLHHRRKTLRFVILLVSFVVILHFIMTLEEDTTRRFQYIDIDIPKNYQPIRLTKREKLPNSNSGVFKIPRIIHQTWKDTNIPPSFVKWIKSWLELHPDWDYWLWTDESAGKLIADKYPHLLEVFYSYTEPIRRADALRYVVLYEYGGVYADMDMEALTPLDPLIMKYSCFIGQEPLEHPVFDTNVDRLVINALIGCREGHYFMKMLLDKLPAFAHMWHYLDSTGPHFVSYVYQEYIKDFPFVEDSDKSVYLAPSEYFYPTIDPDKVLYIVERCKNVNKLSRLQFKACINLKYKYLPENRVNPLAVAFTNHHWSHTYLRLPSRFMFGFGDTSIYDICPSVHIYNLW